MDDAGMGDMSFQLWCAALKTLVLVRCDTTRTECRKKRLIAKLFKLCLPYGVDSSSGGHRLDGWAELLGLATDIGESLTRGLIGRMFRRRRIWPRRTFAGRELT